MDRPFRFGLQLSSPIPGLSWGDTARRVEAAGFSSLVVADHFGEQWGPIVAMTAAAMATTDLRVGCLVFDNDYRHPVTLAKEMASLACLAPGRVEFGLGAGWMRWDYERAGIEYESPKVRVDRFEEGLEIVARLVRGETVDFAGDHYSVDAYPGRPVPEIPPAIMVGGGGPRMLSIAARVADIVAVTSRIPSGAVDRASALDGLPSAVDTKVRWVREASGDRWGQFDMNCLTFLPVITDDAESMAAGVVSMFSEDTSVARGVGASLRVAADAGGGSAMGELSVDDVLDSPAILMGTVPEIVQRLRDRRRRWGFNYVVLQGEDVIEPFQPVIAQLTGT